MKSEPHVNEYNDSNASYTTEEFDLVCYTEAEQHVSVSITTGLGSMLSSSFPCDVDVA